MLMVGKFQEELKDQLDYLVLYHLHIILEQNESISVRVMKDIILRNCLYKPLKFWVSLTIYS